MRLAMSNIAWTPDIAREAYAILQNAGFSGLEFAPGLLFPNAVDPFAPSDNDVAAVMRDIERFDLELVSMQSLHFGAKDAFLFGREESRVRFATAIERSIELAARFSVRNLVIGSPRNRNIPDEVPTGEAEQIAVEVFRNLADKAVKTGQVLAIEPNPAIYGTNFLNSMGEAIRFAKMCDHEAIGVNFDLGALHANDEFSKLQTYLASAENLVSHVHISEPGLSPIPSHRDYLDALRPTFEGIGYDHWVSIEMAKPPTAPLSAIEHAVESVAAAFSAA